MKASKEIRNYANYRRKHDGKKNGVVAWLFDHPEFERMEANNKRLRNRKNDRKIIQSELSTLDEE